MSCTTQRGQLEPEPAGTLRHEQHHLVSSPRGSSSSNNSNSSSSSNLNLTRMHIHINMSNTHQYIPTTTAHEQQQRACSSVSPPAVQYAVQEMDPFNATTGVSSFNYPATADPTLLTPVSSAASPPLQHSPSTKNMRIYHTSSSSTAIPGAQGPTPPNTSTMASHGSGFSDFMTGSQSPPSMSTHQRVDMAGSSQSPPPMVVHHPVVTDAQYMYQMAQSPPGHHSTHHHFRNQHPSPDQFEIPPQEKPFYGQYAVSSENATYHNQIDPSLDGLGTQAPTDMPISAPMSHQQHLAPPIFMAQPAAYQPPSSHIEDLRAPSLILTSQSGPGVYVHHVPITQAGRRVTPRKKATARRTQRLPRGRDGSDDGADGSSAQRDQQQQQQQQQQLDGEDGAAANGSADGSGEKEELMVRADCPEEEQFLFQLRKQFLSERGKGMWEEIRRKFSEQNKGTWEKAALQMKVSRCVAKYGIWPEKEHERLRDAIAYVEERYWSSVLERMKKLGGCKCWDWRVQHLEAEAIKLGLAEPKADEKTGTRRRKAKHIRRQATKRASLQFQQLQHQLQQQQQQHQNPLRQPQPPPLPHMMGHHQHPHHQPHPNEAIMQNWSSGLGLHHPVSFPTGPRHPPYESVPMGGNGDNNGMAAAAAAAADDMDPPPTFTAEQQEEFLDEIFNGRNIKPEPEDEAMSDMDDMDDEYDADPHQQHQQQQQQRRRVEHSRPGIVDNRGIPGDDSRDHSARIARQTCEQMMQQEQMR